MCTVGSVLVPCKTVCKKLLQQWCDNRLCYYVVSQYGKIIKNLGNICVENVCAEFFLIGFLNPQFVW